MTAYYDTGFSVREPQWHNGYDTTIDHYPESIEEAITLAGLDWEPEIRPALCMVAEEKIGERVRVATLDNGLVLVEDPKFRQVLRPDRDQIIGAGVKDGFVLVPNRTLFELAEALTDVESNIKFETAGSLMDGAWVWVLVYLDEPVTVAGDDSETYPFLAVINRHDGKGSLIANYTNVRIVCWNTASAAEAQGAKNKRQFTFRHTGKVLERVEEAKRAIAGLRNDTAEWVKLAEELFGMPVDDVKLNHFLSEFIPMPEADTISERVKGNIDRARATFKHLYLDSVTCAAHTGTALGLVDASVEYLDHVRGYRNRDTYLGRSILRPEPLKAKAVSLARTVAAS